MWICHHYQFIFPGNKQTLIHPRQNSIRNFCTRDAFYGVKNTYSPPFPFSFGPSLMSHSDSAEFEWMSTILCFYSSIDTDWCPLGRSSEQTGLGMGLDDFMFQKNLNLDLHYSPLTVYTRQEMYYRQYSTPQCNRSILKKLDRPIFFL